MQPLHSLLATPSRMDPLTDIDLLRWHIFNGCRGGWEKEMTANKCPFQALACASTAHSCCVIDAHSPTCQQLRSLPRLRRNASPPPSTYISHFPITSHMNGMDKIQQTNIPSACPLTYTTWETDYLEQCFQNFPHLYSAWICRFMSSHYIFISSPLKSS